MLLPRVNWVAVTRVKLRAKYFPLSARLVPPLPTATDSFARRWYIIRCAVTSLGQLNTFTLSAPIAFCFFSLHELSDPCLPATQPAVATHRRQKNFILPLPLHLSTSLNSLNHRFPQCTFGLFGLWLSVSFLALKVLISK